MLRSLAALLLAAALAGAPALAHDGHDHGATRVAYPTTGAEVTPPSRDRSPESRGGAFALTDHTGRAVTDETYRGSWRLMFFGYVGCREACPTGLDTLAAAMDGLGARADEVVPLFVDVSMEEPDLLGLATFVENFHPRIVGLTGERAQTFAVVRAFRVRREYAMTNYSEKETGPRLNHTTWIYLVDPDGATRDLIDPTTPPAEVAAIVMAHMDAYAEATR